MLATFLESIQTFLGYGEEVDGPGLLQAVLRTLLVYLVTLVIVRVGSRRFMAKASAFDVVVGFMLGSIMSRAINGTAPFLPTVLAGAGLLAAHNLIATIAYRFDWFGPMVKGHKIALIKDGKLQDRGMRKTNVTKKELQEALRRQTGKTDFSEFRLAYLERDGKISFVPYEEEKREPRVFVVSVEKGVQTVRIELE